MLDDVEVARLLAQARVHLRAPGAELEDAVLARAREDRRIRRAFAVVGRKAHAHKAHRYARGARLVDRGPGPGNQLARPDLLAVGGLAVRAFVVYQVVHHVEHEIDGGAHGTFL
ncbi:hypothetical protein D3C80_1641180 [compost metagenome]